MYVWNLDPTLFSLGPFEIRWYGLVYMLGFFAGYYLLHKSGTLSKKLAEEYIFLAVMGSIIMSRLFYVFIYNPGYYIRHILEIPAVWQGGLSIHGGLVGGAIVTVLFCKKHRVNMYKITDVLVLPLALAYAFGRIANFVNGELWGHQTTVPWCVVFPGAEGCRHPSQLYQALYGFVLFGMLSLMHWSKRYATGVLTWTFITCYGLFRFIVTFFRALDPTDPGILGLGLGQWLSLGMVLAGCWWFWQVLKTGHHIHRNS